MEAVERAAAVESSDDAYRKLFLETVVHRYTRGAFADPSDTSFPTNGAASARRRMGKSKECAGDPDGGDAVERGGELRADDRLTASAVSRKASAMLELAIGVLRQSLAEHHSEETLARLQEAESVMKELERLDQEAADRHRKRGNEFFKKKQYHEAAMHYTQAMKMNPKDARVFSNRAQCHIYLGALPQGLEDAEKCVKLDPTFLKGYLRKAKVQSLMQNYENALATYLEGLRCDPNNLEVLDGLRRCAACIKRANGGDVDLENLKEMLGNSHSEDVRKYQEAIEQAATFKKEASDEQLKRIESERMAKTWEEFYVGQIQHREETEKYVSIIEEELEKMKVQQHKDNEILKKDADLIEYLQGQLSECRGQYDWLRSEHDHLLHERDRAVREVEKIRQKRQIPSILVAPVYCEFSSSQLKCATENFSSSLKIGEGEFGCVYRGMLRNRAVAIKVLKPDSLQGQSQFEKEVAVLSRARHPHLVTLLGACSKSSTLVYEFLTNGSLEDFLVSAKKRRTLLWQIRVRIIAEICSALIFLHKNRPHPVVHGDLKPANILLDVNLVSKLSDFGISRLLIQSRTDKTLYRTMHPARIPSYVDPEFLATGELTPQSDVYSFGVVVLRLLTGKSPVGIKKIVEDAMEEGDLNSVVDTAAGEWPEVQVQQLAHLALSCMDLNGRWRPDLSGEVWRVVEAMRDAAKLSSTSSSRSGSDEICTPSYFICPISQDVMKDPHIAADGFTYEADAIRNWLDSGHDTSPMTNLRLQHDELIPNHALRSAIQEWLQQQNMTL